MKHIEHDIQCMLVDWFYHNPKTKDYILAAIPNGGHRNIVTAMKLKREGVLAGIPDLVLFKMRRTPFFTNGALLLEMKAPKGKCTPLQLEMHTKLMKEGYCVAVAYSFEEGKKVIENYLRI
jgi:hypothetical protein